MTRRPLAISSFSDLSLSTIDKGIIYFYRSRVKRLGPLRNKSSHAPSYDPAMASPAILETNLYNVKGY